MVQYSIIFLFAALAIIEHVASFQRMAAYVHINKQSTLQSTNRVTGSKEESFLQNYNDFDETEEFVPMWLQKSNKASVDTVKDILSIVFGDRHYARFYALETIARVPYFSYTSVLHLYETLGWFRQKEYIKMHFAESWNELHHLLIMEELGGADRFTDRFVATHLAFFYYWIVIGLYLLNPAGAYDFNKHVERHAFKTYDAYLKSHEEELKQLPASQIAIDYYCKGDLTLVDAFRSSNLKAPLPSKQLQGDGISDASIKITTLYETFANIREDEMEHCQTMDYLTKDITLRSRGRDV